MTRRFVIWDYAFPGDRGTCRYVGRKTAMAWVRAAQRAGTAQPNRFFPGGYVIKDGRAETLIYPIGDAA